MAKIDFSMNDDYHLKIQNGDFVLENSELQQSQVIVDVEKGEIRQFPLLGVGIQNYLGSSLDKTIIYNHIANELKSDDLEAISMSVDIDGTSVTYDIELK